MIILFAQEQYERAGLVKKVICNTAFTQDPHGCFGFPSHDLRGDLKHYRALEIDYNGMSYCIVYRIYDSTAPKWVQVISFAEHDLAYERAKERGA